MLKYITIIADYIKNSAESNGIIMKNFKQTAFARFFTKFPKLMLASLLFTVPFAIVTSIFVLIGYLTGFNNLLVWGLGIIPTFPLYAGLVMVIRKYAIEKTDCNIINTFFSTVKENRKKSLVNGIIAYVIGACAVFALIYYGSAAQTDLMYSSVFTLYVLFSLILLAMLFYVPLMTITYELRIRDIYKNSFLLVFGKILRNIVALLMVAVVTFGAIVALVFSEGFLFVLSAVLITLLYPLIFTYIIISVISKGLQESVGSFTAPEFTEPTEENTEFEKQAVENADNNDDYIFVNGRMIKNPAKNNNQ